MSKTVPIVPVELDRERHLKYDFNTIRLIEQETGKNMLKEESWQDMTGSDMVVFLWASLVWEDKSLTMDDVGAMLHMGNMAEVMHKLCELWNVSMPKAKGDVPNPLPENRPG